MVLISCRQSTSGAADFSHARAGSSRALTELTFQVAIFIQTEKLVPQPQDEVALGLLTLKA